MSLPTREDIIVHGNLDELTACQNFLGKSVAEAEELFRENSLYYQEGLMWMGPKAFCYYVESAIQYVKSPDADGDSDIINCMNGNINFRLEYDKSESIVRVADRLVEFCNYVLENWDWFQVDRGIYGDLQSEYRLLLEKISAVEN